MVLYEMGGAPATSAKAYELAMVIPENRAVPVLVLVLVPTHAYSYLCGHCKISISSNSETARASVPIVSAQVRI